MKKPKIEDIKINSSSDVDNKTSVKILSHKEFAPLDEEIIESKQKDKKNNILLIIGISLVAISIFFYIGHMFSTSIVEIKKTKVQYSFSNELIIANQSETSQLPFTVVEVTDTHHESVVPDLLNSSPKKATGSVIVYNSHSKSKINLKKGTVFIANNNIKFVSDASAVLPGYTIDTAKQIIPGQVIVKITAQNQGGASNIGNSDLTLANYQSQKTKIYARTNELIAGGADQMAYGLSEGLKTSISGKIDEALKKSLFIKAGAEIPDDYILYIDMFTYNPKNLIIAGTPQTLDVSKEASLIAYVIKRKDIEKLIKTRLSDTEPENPQYLGLGDLKVSMASLPTDLKNPQTLSLNFTGSGQVVSYIDTTDLAKKLTKLKVRNAKKLLESIQSLESFKISTRPSFMWLMPKNSNRIKIIDVTNN